MDEKDYAILKELRKDGRASLSKISENTGIPLSTVHDRFTKLDNLILEKHTLILDDKKIGFPIKRQYVFKTVNPRQLLDLMHNHPHLNNFSKLNNSQYYLECSFPDEHTAFVFEESLSATVNSDIQTISVLQQLKKEEFMNN
jgi:DNA-binding Lrp family transcriptional regulator